MVNKKSHFKIDVSETARPIFTELSLSDSLYYEEEFKFFFGTVIKFSLISKRTNSRAIPFLIYTYL